VGTRGLSRQQTSSTFRHRHFTIFLPFPFLFLSSPVPSLSSVVHFSETGLYRVWSSMLSSCRFVRSTSTPNSSRPFRFPIAPVPIVHSYLVMIVQSTSHCSHSSTQVYDRENFCLEGCSMLCLQSNPSRLTFGAVRWENSAGWPQVIAPAELNIALR
jgi:hypothetical protein